MLSKKEKKLSTIFINADKENAFSVCIVTFPKATSCPD